jgi:NTE family protein
MSKVKKKYNLALALGGGGARGLAHIGVLKVLERENIQIDLIVGTSMGSIIGGMYSQLGDASALERKALEFIDRFTREKRWLNVLNTQQKESKKTLLAELSNYVQRRYLGFKALTRIALESKEALYDPLKSILDEKSIEESNTPFAAVSLDLISGATKVLTSGSIIDAVYASSAIEGVFPPLEYNGSLLGDGGPVNITPVEVARNLDSRYVIAVDVHQKIKKVEQFANGLEVIMRADNLGLDRLRQTDLALADLVIAPNVGSIHWANFNKARECIRRGEQAAEMMIPSLRNVLLRTGFFGQLKRRFRQVFRDLSETENK